MAKFESIIDGLLTREGGYVNHPLDKGGATKYGITHTVLAIHRKVKAVTPKDVENLTKTEAVEIYKRLYWMPLRCNEITSQEVADALFDFGVNSGVTRAVKYGQMAFGLTADGIIGPKTMAALNAPDADETELRICFGRAIFVLKIAANNPSQVKFQAGWANRLDELVTKKVSA